jgi:hypothetical protein
MAKRPERARDEMPTEQHAAPPVPAAPAVTPSSQPTSQPIAFRAFDAARIDAEFVSAEAQVQTAVDHYESAKTISQRVLDARVCL